MTGVQESIARYLRDSGHSFMRLKAVLFDMDGVLFDSMPYHADAWVTTMARHSLPMTREQAFMNEGRTGMSTISMVYQQKYGTEPPKELVDRIYKEKCDEFSKHPEPAPMPGAYELIRQLQADGITPVLVTGSGQYSLFERIARVYPGMFAPDKMVTAYDVRYGKPHPEPYLMGLRKAGAEPWEAVVVENAPIGVRAGVAAGVFTIAVNTGPLRPEALLGEGANLLYPSMRALSDDWQRVKSFLLN